MPLRNGAIYHQMDRAPVRYYLIFKNIKTGRLLAKHYQFRSKKDLREAIRGFHKVYPVRKYLYITSVSLIVVI